MSSTQTVATLSDLTFVKVEAFDKLEGPGVLLMIPHDRRRRAVARGGQDLAKVARHGERPPEPFDAFILAHPNGAGMARYVRCHLKVAPPVITETVLPVPRSIWRLVERKEKRCMFFTVSVSQLSESFMPTAARIYRNKRNRVWNDANITLKQIDEGVWTEKEVRARLKELRKLTKHGIYTVV